MRVQMLLLALASTPLVAAVAQQGAAAVKDPVQCQTADDHRSSNSWSQDPPPDPHGRERTGCAPVAPTPPPPPPQTGASILGSVYNAVTGSALSGWVVTLSGAANASTTTNSSGNYAFSGLSAGTYTVCEVVASGWVQTAPSFPASCPSGKGYTFSLSATGTASFVSFGNTPL
jgi:hypothetical protein